MQTGHGLVQATNDWMQLQEEVAAGIPMAVVLSAAHVVGLIVPP
jgi:hypothetical protein